jgi:tetratricopeptide (TPR) repeat protein
VQLLPGDTRAAYDLGVNLYRLAEAIGDTSLHREAREHFHFILERMPEDEEAQYNLALVFYRVGEIDEAQTRVDALLRSEPLHARGQRLAARVYLALGDTARARGHVVAMRGLGGDPAPVPTSALDVSAVAGQTGAKRFVLTGRPERVFRYRERSGQTVEVWFYLRRLHVYGFSDGNTVADLDLGREG